MEISFILCIFILKNEKKQAIIPVFFLITSYLTRREQEIPHFYKWWDELRNTRC